MEPNQNSEPMPQRLWLAPAAGVWNSTYEYHGIAEVFKILIMYIYHLFWFGGRTGGVRTPTARPPEANTSADQGVQSLSGIPNTGRPATGTKHIRCSR
mgnify:CR=1 FL=1